MDFGTTRSWQYWAFSHMTHIDPVMPILVPPTSMGQISNQILIVPAPANPTVIQYSQIDPVVPLHTTDTTYMDGSNHNSIFDPVAPANQTLCPV